MKRTVNTIAFFALSLFFFNFSSDKTVPVEEKIAAMSFETEVIDYGTILQNADGKKIFTFTNTGNAPLLITKVKTSCGCTVPSYSKAPILPGDKGQLEIHYNTRKVGAFVKTVTVVSNAQEGNKILKIKGNVVVKK